MHSWIAGIKICSKTRACRCCVSLYFTEFEMTPTRNFRVLSVILVLIIIHLIIAKLSVYRYNENGRNHFPNEHQCAPDRTNSQYPFDNLTMVSQEDALKIQEIWEEELSELTLQRNSSVMEQTIEAGGQPERVIIISTWRSGSTYFGTVVRSRPGTHYFFEPLHNLFQDHVVREDSEVKRALQILRILFHCQDLEGRHNSKALGLPHYFNRNFKFLDISNRTNIQWDPAFVTFMCRRSPILAMKTVRLKLRHASTLLEDGKLNLKVVYLVRDPRATMNSRLEARSWCSEIPDCINFSTLCSDLVDDFNVAKDYEREYPDRFTVVTYENLLMSPRTSEQLSEVLGISPNAFTVSTRAERESQLTKWTRDLGRNMSILRDIQVGCAEAMELWGYVPINTYAHI